MSNRLAKVEAPKPILDYSSPAQERARQQTAEGEHRQAIGRYNESTFGERRPIGFAFLRIMLLCVVASSMAIFLPRSIGRTFAGLTVTIFLVWEVKKTGLQTRWSLRQPFRWW